MLSTPRVRGWGLFRADIEIVMIAVDAVGIVERHCYDQQVHVGVLFTIAVNLTPLFQVPSNIKQIRG